MKFKKMEGSFINCGIAVDFLYFLSKFVNQWREKSLSGSLIYLISIQKKAE